MTDLIITTGNETFREGSSRLIVSAVRSTEFPDIGNAPYFTEFPDRLSFAQADRPRVFNAASSGPQEQGRFFRQRITLPDNLLLIVFGSKTVGRMATNCRMVLRVRENAALQRIVFRRIEGQLSNPFDAEISGRFDIITLRDALRLHNARISLKDMQTYDPSRRAALFSIREVSPERSRPPLLQVEKVQTPDGKITQVRSKVPRRAVDLG